MNMELGYIDDEDSEILDHPPHPTRKTSSEKKGFNRISKKKSDKIQVSSSVQVSQRISINLNRSPDESFPSSTPQSLVISNEEKAKPERKGTGPKLEMLEYKNNEKGDEIKKSPEIRPISEDHSNPESCPPKINRKPTVSQTFVSSEACTYDDKLRNTFSTNSDFKGQFEEDPKLSNSLVLMRQKEVRRMKSKEYKTQKACVKCLIF